MKKQTALFAKLRNVFRQHVSQPVEAVIEGINPILRGWVNYFRIGHASRCFSKVRDWVEMKIRRNLMRARLRKGKGGKRWGREWMHRQKATWVGAISQVPARSCVVVDPRHAWKLHAREPGGLGDACCQPVAGRRVKA